MGVEAGRSLCLRTKHSSSSSNNWLRLRWTYAKTTYKWPTGVCKRAPCHPLTIGKHKPDPWDTTSFIGKSSTEEEGTDSSAGEGVESRDPGGGGVVSEFSLVAISMEFPPTTETAVWFSNPTSYILRNQNGCVVHVSTLTPHVTEALLSTAGKWEHTRPVYRKQNRKLYLDTCEKMIQPEKEQSPVT